MIKGACWLGYGSKECIDQRKIYDAKFYATNTSMLNLYAKCLYQKVPGVSNGKHFRLPHGVSSPNLGDSIICEDMVGIINFFNEPTMQVRLHVTPQTFQPCSDDVGTNYTMF